LDSNEKVILIDWYNSLTSKGTLDWNITNDLCGQTGVTCDDSIPQSVKILYDLFFFQPTIQSIGPIVHEKKNFFFDYIETSTPKKFQEQSQHNSEIYQIYKICKRFHLQFLFHRLL